MPLSFILQQAAHGHGGGGGTPSTVDALLRSGILGQGRWYDQRGANDVGSATGDLDWDGRTLDRFGIVGGLLVVNTNGGGALDAWASANPGYALTITIGGSVITKTAADQASAGTGVLRWNVTSADVTVFNSIAVGTEISVVVTP